MFDKEAEEYALENYENCLYDDFPYTNDSRAREQSFKDGAEFGYNKANKWHYVKDGDLPKGKGAVLIYWKSGDLSCAFVVESYKVLEYTHIIAWKEIVLPELPEESEYDS